MDSFVPLLTSLGVSAPAGWNAYLALLLVGLGGRFGWVTLSSPYDVLQRPLALVILTVLLTIEVVIDKIPALDSVNDLVGTLVRPVAGAILFAATAPGDSARAEIAALLSGALAAGSFHTFKAGTRPVWTASTAGLANPVVSVFEDIAVGATVVLAMLVPVLAMLVLLAILALTVFILLRLRRGLRRLRGSA